MRVDSQGRDAASGLTQAQATRAGMLCGYTHENEQEKEARKETRQA